MGEALVGMKRERSLSGKAAVRIGIGMHSGEVMAGNVGSSKKLQRAAIGDIVNPASRIEGLNKDYGSFLLVSGTTWEPFGEGRRGLDFEGLPGVPVRGKAWAVDIYRLA